MPPTLAELPWLKIAAVWLLLVNLHTFAAFWFDKRAALRGTWRTPESSLLKGAFLGGTPGAFLARRVLRHKTRKQPFVGQLKTIACLQIIGLGGAVGWWGGGLLQG
ncbi:MAG: DUF1294 domain-containing protein [Novosphingobium sp.]